MARKSFLPSMISVTFEGMGSIMSSREIVELETFEYKVRVEKYRKRNFFLNK